MRNRIYGFLLTFCACYQAYAARVEECGIESPKSGTAGWVCGWKTQASSSCAKLDGWGKGEAGVKSWEQLRDLSCPGAEDIPRYSPNSGRCDANDFYAGRKRYCDTNSAGEEVNCEWLTLCVDYELVPKCRTPQSRPLLFISCEHPDHGAKTCQNSAFGNNYRDCAQFDRAEIQSLINSTLLIETLSSSYIALEGSLITQLNSRNSLGCTIRDYDNNILANRSGIVEQLKDSFFILYDEEYTPLTSLNCGSFSRSLAIPALPPNCEDSHPHSYCVALDAYWRSMDVLETNYNRAKSMFEDVVSQNDSSINDQLKSLLCSDHTAFSLLSSFNFSCD